MFQAAFAGTVVGIEAPSGSRNLELKPYAISDLLTDRRAVPQVSNAVLIPEPLTSAGFTVTTSERVDFELEHYRIGT